jgi:hypothetical protein
MERAQRAAANPLRVILEAAKVDAAGSVRRVPPRPSVSAAPASGDAGASPRESGAAAAPTTAAAPGPAAVPEPALSVLPALPGGAARVERAEAVSALGTLAMPQLPAAPALEARSLLDAKPKLVKMVPPDVPERVLAQLVRNEVNVDLVIRPDGSVSEVTMLPPAPRMLKRFVVEALERWTFEPLPAPTTHRVQLVFNNP